MKAIIKYRSHPRFSQTERDEIMKEINNHKTNKATQSTDIPTKLIMENSYIFQT